MLVRNTILYLPAQLLPSIATFVSLIIWSHLSSAEIIGKITLLVSIQEFLVLGLMGFWTMYSFRYASSMSVERQRLLASTSKIVVFGSSFLQAVIAILLYLLLVGAHDGPLILPLAGAMVAGRSINNFQAEQARARGDIWLYSVGVMAGPVMGLGVGFLFIWLFGPTIEAIVGGFALAQAAAFAYCMGRDRSWLARGAGSWDMVREAWRYGLPLLLGAVFGWLTQNIGRLLVNHYSGLAATGFYALGFGLGLRVATVAAMSVTAAAFPIAMRHANAGDHDKAMAQLSTNVVMLMLVMAPTMVGFALVSRDILSIFIAAPMRAAVYPVMLWAILAGSLICFRQHFLHQVFLLNGKTSVIGRVSMGESMVAVVTAFIAVPRWGATGGIVSLAATSALSMVVMLILALRAGLRPPWWDFAKIGLATVAMALAVWMTPMATSVPALCARVAAGCGAFILAAGLLYGREIYKLAIASRRIAG